MGGSNSSGGGVAGAQPASSMPTSSFGPSRVDVVVLCGSAGSRLFPLTASPGSPKCLLPLANQPVLSYLLASLAKLGFVTVHLATTAEFQAPLQAFLAMYQGPQPKHVHLFVAPPECGGTAEALQAMRSGGQLPGSDDKGAAAAASGGGGSDSATAPLSPSSLSSQLRGENVLVVPGECVVESQLLDLLDLHQRQGSDLTMLLAKESQMGADADTAGDSSSGGGGGGGGGKAAAAAKAKAAGGAKKPKRDPEDVEYVGLCSLTDSASNQGDHSYGTASSGSSSANGKNSCVGQRLMLKVPALAVEEDLQVPKTLLARAALLGHGGGRLQLRTDLNDPHVYVFSKYVLFNVSRGRGSAQQTGSGEMEGKSSTSTLRAPSFLFTGGPCRCWTLPNRAVWCPSKTTWCPTCSRASSVTPILPLLLLLRHPAVCSLKDLGHATAGLSAPLRRWGAAVPARAHGRACYPTSRRFPPLLLRPPLLPRAPH